MRLRQLRVGRDHANRGVLAGSWRLAGPAAPQDLSRVGEGAVRVAYAGDDLAGGGIDDVADGIDRDDGGDDEAARQDNRRAADARFHRPAGSAELADGRARAGADRSFRHRCGRRRRGGFVAAVGGRPHFRVSADAEIEQDRRRDDRHFRGARGPADVVLLEPADRPRRRVEAERAAAGQDDRVDLVDHVERVQEIRFARAGRAASLRDAADRVAVDEDHGAAGRPLGEREVADLDAGDRGERRVGFSSPARLARCASARSTQLG